jgi:hypothetical protein
MAAADSWTKDERTPVPHGPFYVITGPNGEQLYDEWGEDVHPVTWPLTDSPQPKCPPSAPVSGWHLMPAGGLPSHVAIGVLFLAEGRGESVSGVTTTAFTSVRLLRPLGEITHPVLVSLACDWAEHAQPDPVPHESATALAAARAWAACPCEDHAAAALSTVSPAFAAGEDASACAAATAAFGPAYAGILARATAAHAAEQAARYGQSVLEGLEALWSLDS